MQVSKDTFSRPKEHVARVIDLVGKYPIDWKRASETVTFAEAEARNRHHRNGRFVGWPDNRKYNKHYNAFFGEGLGKFFGKTGPMTIGEAFASVPRQKNRPFVLVEDGAGKGFGLSGAVRDLEKRGVPVHSVALAYNPHPTLLKRTAIGRIKEVSAGTAEAWVPRQKIDGLISVFGSIHYTMPQARKDHLLKFATSLNKGGIMLVGFDEIYLHQPGLKDNERFKANLVASFAKRGFRAEVHPLDRRNLPRINGEDKAIPHNVLIVQRIK